jgi:hypothetical protein
MTGVPVVPELEWMRTIFSSGTAARPSGYASRKVLLGREGQAPEVVGVRHAGDAGLLEAAAIEVVRRAEAFDLPVDELELGVAYLHGSSLA